jgi:hypothetical protein
MLLGMGLEVGTLHETLAMGIRETGELRNVSVLKIPHFL